MTKQKVIEILTIIKSTYFYAFKDLTKEQFSQLCSVWYECLKCFSDEQVSDAIRMALMEHSTPPVPADIVKYAKQSLLLEQPTDTEFWNKLMTAVDKIKNTYVQEYKGSLWKKALFELNNKSKCEEIYEELPIEVKKTIDFQTFILYAGLDEKSLSIERNRFLKAIPEKREIIFNKKLTQQNNLLMENKNQLKLQGSKL